MMHERTQRTMADTTVLKRDKRGDWRPPYRLELPPIFAWPPKPLAVVKWLFGFPGYVWPWNTLYLGIAVLTWYLLTPDLATMQTLEAGWIALILARNAAMTFLIVGAWHLYFYILKRQGTDYRYTDKPLARNSDTFLFRNQVHDNMFWTFASGVPLMTAYEALTWWAWANGWLPWVDLATDPVWFIVLLVLIPAIRELHFYLIHRLIHWKPLYDWVHHLHHRNVNIGPWTGLSMHPVEHLLYFSGILVHWIVPSHPIHALFHLQHAAFSPAAGHCGYDRIVLGDGRALRVDNYFHYLHHRYFECNYSGDGMPILDKIFGTYHDGSDEAQERMNRRFRARAARQAR
jgi:sterol desaturase/sphingolipid hydroxylase (fatty acid hydroxylase superfamily)